MKGRYAGDAGTQGRFGRKRFGKHQGRRWDSVVSPLTNRLGRAGKGAAR